MTEHHKQVAQQLRAVLAEQGIIIQHAHALHIIAAAGVDSVLSRSG